jgi:valyl-tRNA synthetase
MEFGTGVVKITPAHDPNDFEIGKRHGLPMINILNDDASLNDLCPELFRGLDRFDARKKIVKELKNLGLFEKEESIKNAVPYSDRGKVPIEPRLSKQWYVKMNSLAGPALEAARNGSLKFYPDSWKKTYFHWLENIKDWCISRQLWWGHRIPIWYCGDCNHVTTGMEDPKACSHCGSKALTQDEDVLDTWFSSWLFAQSTFGWPKKTEDLSYYYPTNVLITGPDIIFLWVARMVMVGFETLGELPFKDVYFNSIICDKDGRKFSKTLGNGIDPLVVMDQYGADAVRYTCVSLSSIGGRVRMSPTDFEVGRNFINKIWNAARFLMTKTQGISIKPLSEVQLELPSKWMITELKHTSAAVNKHLEAYQINEAVEKVYQLIWRGFCDWGLESAKLSLDSKDLGVREACASALFYVFEGALRLAAPIIPFVTEEIWSKIPRHPDFKASLSLATAAYPLGDEIPAYEEEFAKWELVQELVVGIRSARQQAGVPLKDKLDVFVNCSDSTAPVFKEASPWILKLTSTSKLEAGPSTQRPARCLVAVGRGFEAFVPVGEYLDFDREKIRLENELKRVSKVVDGMKAKLSNASFVERAPPEVIELTKNQMGQMEEQLSSLKKNLEAIS